MLVRDDDLAHMYRFAARILDADLTLGIGTQLAFVTGMTNLSQPFQDAMGIKNRSRHKFRRFAAGITKHDALVAGTFILVAAGIDALGNIGRLIMQQNIDIGSSPMEAVLLIANVLDRRRIP